MGCRTYILFGVKIPKLDDEFLLRHVMDYFGSKGIDLTHTKDKRRYNYTISFDNTKIVIHCLFYRKKICYLGIKDLYHTYYGGGSNHLEHVYLHNFSTEVATIMEICKALGHPVDINDFNYYVHTDSNVSS